MPDDLTIDQRLTALEQLHANFQIIGGSNVTVEGSIHKGYAICSTCPDTGEVSGGGGIVIINTPPILNGACCFEDGTCTVEQETQCTDAGGTYQGDETVCEPNPCVLSCGDCPVYVGLSGSIPAHYYLSIQIKTVCFSHAEDEPNEVWVQVVQNYTIDPEDCSLSYTSSMTPEVENCFTIPCTPWTPETFLSSTRCDDYDCFSVDSYTALIPQSSDTDWIGEFPGDSPYACEVHLFNECIP